MTWNVKKLGPIVALTLISVATTGFAADQNRKSRERAQKEQMDMCAPEPAAPCYNVDTWQCDYCLGPDMVNPAVRPKTCDGDFVLTIAGFYWNAHQDGMEYAIRDNVAPTTPDHNNRSNIINARLLNPNFKWDWGFKLGIGYDSNHDGWDFELIWTNYNGKAFTNVDGDTEDNFTLLPIWSAMQNNSDHLTLYATQIRTHWKLDLDLVDLELGREFWVSKYMTLRPHIGLRFARINQSFDLYYFGGSWDARGGNGELELDNDFKGAGVRGGLDSTWIIGRGFAFFGNAAISIVYGRFDVDYDEDIRAFSPSFVKTPIAELEDNFRSSKGMTDLAIGLQWSTMFSNCQYGFTLQLAWEHHLFFNQNQLWRIQRVGADDEEEVLNSGENVFEQRRGDLSTQGWTLTARFEF